MKKVLLATSALVATAGMAAADVTLSGYGRFGILYVENAAVETRVESRFRLNIDASTEADGGLKFGARVRMQSDDTAAGGSTVVNVNAPRFTVSAGGLTVGVGNILGAIDSAPVIVGGQFGLSGVSWANYITDITGADTYDSTGVGRSGVEVIYSMGDFGAHVSHSSLGVIDRTAIHLSYKVSGFTFAVGYQDSNIVTDTEYFLTANGTVGAFGVHAGFAQEHDGSNTAAIAGSYAISAATKVGAFIAYDEDFKGVPGRDEMAYGLEVEHSLGGGATILGAVSTNHGSTVADLGVQFNF